MPPETKEKLRILVVEDDDGVAATLKDTIEKAVSGAECILQPNFETACNMLNDQVFDAVVLDQFDDSSETNQKAKEVWRVIWDLQFVPVVVYSAFDLELDEDFPGDHPVLTHIAKSTQHDAVAKHLALISPYLLQLQVVRKEVRLVVREALHKVVPHISKTAQEIVAGKPDQLARVVRRRIAARMDLNTVLTDSSPAAWEQYIQPPLDGQWLMGDVLRLSEGNAKDPGSYRMVLTPSCDLANTPGRKRKVSKVLVCKCGGMEPFTKIVGEKPDNLARYLTEPQTGGFVPLPGYHGVIPQMIGRLRDLELIPVEEIGDDEKSKYARVASVDSPFREQIAWAFVQIAGRPAVPDRELESWIAEITAESTAARRNREKDS